MKKIAFAVLLAIAVAAGLSVEPSAAIDNFAMVGGEKYFRFDWEPGQRGGRPDVRGWIFNDWGFAAEYIKIKVESLDAAGHVTATTLGDVKGWVMPGAHEYFEIPVPARSPAYRVSIVAWTWMQRGGGTSGKP